MPTMQSADTEYEKARQRISAQSEGATGWLLRFASTDLTQLSEGQWSDLIAEVSVFATGVTYYDAVPHSFAPKVDMGLWESAETDLVGRRKTVKTLALKRPLIQGIQHKLKVAIDSVLERPFTDLPIPNGITIRVFNQAPEGTPSYEWRAKTLNDAFDIHAWRLLGESAAKLKRCGACANVFYAVRKDQVFCSTSCLNRVNQQRYRERLKGRKKNK